MQTDDGTPAQRNAGLGMARLADFIGGVHFSTESISPNLARANEESQNNVSGNPHEEGLRVRIVDTGRREINEEPSQRERQNTNNSTEFRIRTIVNGVEQRSNSNEDNEVSSVETERSYENPSISQDDSNASRLVDIIQLLGSVAGSGSGALRIRRRDTRPNESTSNVTPRNQSEDPRVPSIQNPVASSSRSNSQEQNDVRIQQAPMRNDNQDEQQNTRRRSHLGQQGFIIFPPDPRNVGRGPSILYFGGSGQNDRASDSDTISSSQNESNSQASTSSESSSSHNSQVNPPYAYTPRYNLCLNQPCLFLI